MRRWGIAAVVVMTVIVAVWAWRGTQEGSTGGCDPDAPLDSLLFSAGLDSVQRSIGDEIVGADLLVRGRIGQLGAPQWNSEDGTDWRSEYEAHPAAYVTIPGAYIPAPFVVDEILLTSPRIPPVSVGDTLEVDVFEPFVRSCGSVVFMLERTRLYGNMETPRPIWTAGSQGTWRVDGEMTTPIDREQSYSLTGAIWTGAVPGSVDPDNLEGSVSLDTFRTVIDEEARTEKVDVAGFRQWPTDTVYDRLEQMAS